MTETKHLTISEIKKELEQVSNPNDPMFEKLADDPRKGVQKLIRAWHKKYTLRLRDADKYEHMMYFEKQLIRAGHTLVMGIDEAGRGPLAGPVVAACVCLDLDQPIYGLDDSKKLSAQKLETLCEQIKSRTKAYGIGIVSAAEIDELGIRPATHLAMKKAYEQTYLHADALLIDAETVDLLIRQYSLIKGDQKSNSIAAASILAKCTRDRLMVDYSQKYPEYHFDKHMGYGTQEHIKALKRWGPCPIHRRTFSPVKKYQK